MLWPRVPASGADQIGKAGSQEIAKPTSRSRRLPAGATSRPAGSPSLPVAPWPCRTVFSTRFAVISRRSKGLHLQRLCFSVYATGDASLAPRAPPPEELGARPVFRLGGISFETQGEKSDDQPVLT